VRRKALRFSALQDYSKSTLALPNKLLCFFSDFYFAIVPDSNVKTLSGLSFMEKPSCGNKVLLVV
jgi:hypothetical protein